MLDAYYNGSFMKREEVRIPLTNRSVFFGDAVYDAAIGRNGNIFMLYEHIDRLLLGAQALSISVGYTREELRELLLKLVALSEIRDSDYFVYFQLSRSLSERRHSYPDGCGSSLLITVTPITLLPEKRRLELVSYPDVRYGLCNVKTVNLLPAVLASKYAEDMGADEAVFIREGTVTECAHSNAHIIRGGILYTHPESCRILSGISRRHLLDVCRRSGIEYREQPFSPDEMKQAEAVLVTSASKLCLKAARVDDAEYGECLLADYLLEKMRRDYRDFCGNLR